MGRLGVGPESSDWCLYKRKERKIWTETAREEGHVNTEAGIGVTQSHKPRDSKDCQ